MTVFQDFSYLQPARQVNAVVRLLVIAHNERTFCTWRRNGDPSWQTGQIEYPDEDDPDGSEDLVFILNGDPKTYREFGEQYYERSIDLGAVTSIYEQQSLTPQLIESLNPKVLLESLTSDLEQIDYSRSAI